jgi:hypothetical protein
MVAGLVALLSGCASTKALKPANWHLPWHRAATPAPAAVQELSIQSEVTSAASVQQYWSRNTLRVDLTGLSGSGTLQLQANAANGWPARLEFAVRPGSMAQLEVKGEQRVVFPVPASDAGGTPLVLPLSPTAYGAATRLLTVSWN